jgi:hypothetical protein
MLNLDPRQRINAQGTLKHPWLVNMDSLSDVKLNVNDSESMKGAVAAAFRVFNPERFLGPGMLNLSPVVSSGLAKRRINKINSNV